jgi:acyl-CoA oxidase
MPDNADHPRAATVAAMRSALDGRWAHIREALREQLDVAALSHDPTLGLHDHRQRVREQLKVLADTGYPASGFPDDQGGSGDIGGSATSFEMLAHADLSLLVKAGVQWGLFGGAVSTLGTKEHHQLVPDIIDLSLPGCFAMTETGRGSDVQSLRTTATYDAQALQFVVHTPDRSAYKDYIGGAASDARMACVFAQLITPDGVGHGVHCFLVPLRDDDGNLMPGVHAEDDGPKIGLNGVDNGRLAFDSVRVPRTALLNRYADVAEDGTYSSPIDNPDRRFFTMLGTLIRGRISVGGAAGSAARLALAVALRYAEQRTQFERPDGTPVTILDYRMHQRRLLPLLARSYALAFAQNEMVSRLHDIATGDNTDEHDQRELESRAAGLKAITTWHATRALQECREACGGAGYLLENRIGQLKSDTDVFTTFEGDNHVLLQLVAKELLTGYARDFSGMDTLATVRFVTRRAAGIAIERTTARELLQRLVDSARSRSDEEAGLLDRGTHLRALEDREVHLLETLAGRLRRAGADDADAFAVYNNAQDHVVQLGRAHVERVVLEAFVAAIARCPDPEGKRLLNSMCDLYVLSCIDADKAWFLEHGRLTPNRGKAVTAALNSLCGQLRPEVGTLVDALGIPDEWLGASMLLPFEEQGPAQA